MEKMNGSVKRIFKIALCAVFTMAFVIGAVSVNMAEASQNAANANDEKVCAMRHAESGHSGGHHGKEKHGIPGKSVEHMEKILKYADALGLDESQKSKIDDLYIKAKGSAAAIRARMEVTAGDFRSLYRKGGVTEKAINDYAKKMGGLKASLLLNNLEASFDVKKMLTPEQKEKLKDLYKFGGKGDCKKNG